MNAAETPEAFLVRIADEFDMLTALSESEGIVLCQELGKRDAAIVAQHTAELTARIRELEAANLELGLELKRGELGVTTVALMASKERIAALEAQLTASAQREALARAEAREAALREAVEAIRGMPAEWPEVSKLALSSALARVEKLLTSPPSPRVDAWIPVGPDSPPRRQGDVLLYVHGMVIHGHSAAIDEATHWQPLPPPPAHQPAAGTEGSSDG